MAKDITLTFHSFEYDDEGSMLTFYSPKSIKIDVDKYYLGMLNSKSGARVMHLEFEPLQGVANELMSYLTLESISSHLVAVDIGNTRFKGIIERSKTSLSLNVFKESDIITGNACSIKSLNVVLLIFEVPAGQWDKFVR